jgi:hypothetical protein
LFDESEEIRRPKEPGQLENPRDLSANTGSVPISHGIVQRNFRFVKPKLFFQIISLSTQNSAYIILDNLVLRNIRFVCRPENTSNISAIYKIIPIFICTGTNPNPNRYMILSGTIHYSITKKASNRRMDSKMASYSLYLLI